MPGLLGPRGDREVARIVAGGLHAPALERFLCRARRFELAEPEARTVEGLLFTAFGMVRPPQGDWPVAAVTYALDTGTTPREWCARADPVHMRADLRDVTVLDPDLLELGATEAQALADELNAHLAGEGWQLEVGHPRRWYLRLPHAQHVRTQSLSQACGGRLDELMPEGEDAARWRRGLNEVQMALHASRVNRERERRRTLTVNSLWFWGGGWAPPAPARRWTGVWGEDPLAAALARLADTPRAGTPESAGAWLREAEPGEHLLVEDRAHRLVRNADMEGWRGFVQEVERSWMQPLLAALGRGELEALTLLPGREHGYRAGRWTLRRPWVRVRALPEVMATH